MAYSDTGREKQSGRHDTSLISRYWKPAAITAASLTQIFPPLFGCLRDPRASENWRAAENRTARRLHGWTGRTGRFNAQTAELHAAVHEWGLGGCSAVDGDLRPGDVAALVGE